jgi:peptidoglycan hydrolase CwlO-like protein
MDGSMTTQRATTRTLSRRIGGAIVALALVAGFGSVADADTRSQLDAAKTRLTELEKQIKSQQAQADRMHTNLVSLASFVTKSQATFDHVGGELAYIEGQLQNTHDRFVELRSQLDQRVRDLFMEGSGTGVDLVLGATSLSDLSDRLEIVNRQSEVDAGLAQQVQTLAGSLKTSEGKLHKLFLQQGRLFNRLSAQKAALDSAFAAQQDALAALVGSRSEATTLVRRLGTRLQAEQLRAANAAINAGAMTTYGEWAKRFLPALGAPACQNNLVVVVAWETQEGSPASWNPLDTTLDMPGATNFNSVGVKNYVSMEQGIQATVATLMKGSGTYGYGAIVADLRGCADPYTTGVAVNASRWCYGCVGGAYVVQFIAAVQTYYAQYANR